MGGNRDARRRVALLVAGNLDAYLHVHGQIVEALGLGLHVLDDLRRHAVVDDAHEADGFPHLAPLFGERGDGALVAGQRRTHIEHRQGAAFGHLGVRFNDPVHRVISGL